MDNQQVESNEKNEIQKLKSAKSINSKMDKYKEITFNIREIEEKSQNEDNKLGNLYKLFTSEYFTINMLIEYLTKRKEVGIIDFLCNLLCEKPFIDEALFYLQELCSLIKAKTYSKPIQDVILLKCSEEPLFAVCAQWTIDSFLQTNYYKFHKLVERIETSSINGCLNRNIQNFDLEYFLLKEQKLAYYENTIELFQKIKRACEKLYDIKSLSKKNRNSTTNSKNEKPFSKYQLRKNYLTKILNSFNRKIKAMVNEGLENISKGRRNKFKGYLLPFQCALNKSIVNFLTEYSFCYYSKARVPVKITCECVDLTESGIEDKKLEPLPSIVDRIIETIYSDEEDENNKEFEIKEEDKVKASQIIDQIKQDNEHPNENNSNIDIKGYLREFNSNLTEVPNPYKENWSEKEKNIKMNSKFKKFTSLSVISFIAKANDDLRQEQMTMHLIKKFDEIFKKVNLPLRLHPYEIIITSAMSGIIEYIPDTLSIHSIKKELLPYKCSFSRFFKVHFKDNFLQCQKNFTESLAAYSLVCYLLAIKDRHNGNILLDINGNIIHIDFGFILGISPGGNLNFENAPFKLTKDYIKIMGGFKSELFIYFTSLFTRGLLEARKHISSFINIVRAVGSGISMPCFHSSNSIDDIINKMSERFLVNISEEKVFNIVSDLIKQAANSWRTTQYDLFQKLTNGILP